MSASSLRDVSYSSWLMSSENDLPDLSIHWWMSSTSHPFVIGQSKPGCEISTEESKPRGLDRISDGRRSNIFEGRGLGFILVCAISVGVLVSELKGVKSVQIEVVKSLTHWQAMGSSVLGRQ